MTRPDVVRDLSPERIAAYLAARDWREVDTGLSGDTLAYYVCAFHEPAHEAAFPRSDHWTDYGRSVSWGLAAVAECEGRPSPALQLYRDMQGFETGKVHHAIHVTPGIQFGQPCIEGTRVPSETIAAWYFANGLDDTRRSYEVTRGQILVACWFEAIIAKTYQWRKKWRAWAESAEVWDALWRAEYSRCPLPPREGD